MQKHKSVKLLCPHKTAGKLDDNNDKVDNAVNAITQTTTVARHYMRAKQLHEVTKLKLLNALYKYRVAK